MPLRERYYAGIFLNIAVTILAEQHVNNHEYKFRRKIMSKRTDIIDPATELSAPVGLVYSEILGWIDLGHALGRDIKRILEQMAEGEKGSAPCWVISNNGVLMNVGRKPQDKFR